MYKVPILFVIFNRPSIAEKSFQAIKQIRPSDLYIACDGARKDHEGETNVVDETRKRILSAIDWPCNVKTLFQETNLGCGMGVYTAIDWFFQENEFGIILEDDCVANESFFGFMQEMLTRYRHDQRIGMVAGTNVVEIEKYPYSYLFSKYKSCWGWGTWQRAWKNMDIEMSWRKMDERAVLLNAGYRGKDVSGWKYKIRCIERGYVSAWDWQWYFSLAAQNQLCIYPTRNLVSNIGTDANATHTAFSSITKATDALSFPLSHPSIMAPYAAFDKKFYRQSNTWKIRLARLIPHHIKLKIKQLIHILKA